MSTSTLNEMDWERPLLALARPQTPPPSPLRSTPAAVLDQAYRYCEAVTAWHSRSFHLASALLPPAKRRAVRALYAFCRVSDDLVDLGPGSPEERRQRLHAWRARALGPVQSLDDPVALAFADTRARFAIPDHFAHQLIDGVAQDLEPHPFHTFADLTRYAYGVASTVGLMSMHIIGFSSPEAVPYAIRLGIALQVTNILRDVGEDARAGRLYLPLEELEAFGLRAEEVFAGIRDARWRRFMRFQVERNRRLYEQAWPGIAFLDADGRLSIAAAAGLYRAILEDIERHDYDVFRRRAHLGAWAKLARLPGLWWASRRARLPGTQAVTATLPDLKDMP